MWNTDAASLICECQTRIIRGTLPRISLLHGRNMVLKEMGRFIMICFFPFGAMRGDIFTSWLRKKTCCQNSVPLYKSNNTTFLCRPGLCNECLCHSFSVQLIGRNKLAHKEQQQHTEVNRRPWQPHPVFLTSQHAILFWINISLGFQLTCKY